MRTDLTQFGAKTKTHGASCECRTPRRPPRVVVWQRVCLGARWGWLAVVVGGAGLEDWGVEGHSGLRLEWGPRQRHGAGYTSKADATKRTDLRNRTQWACASSAAAHKGPEFGPVVPGALPTRAGAEKAISPLLAAKGAACTQTSAGLASQWVVWTGGGAVERCRCPPGSVRDGS